MLRHRRDDTLDESLLALASNRSPDSLTAIAKRYINPSTGKPYTRAAISARLTELSQRTGLVLRIQRSERVQADLQGASLEGTQKEAGRMPPLGKGSVGKGHQKGRKKTVRTGSKVVCVDDRFPPEIIAFYNHLPIKDRQYTIRGVGIGVAPTANRAKWWSI
jgi:hypothetical protein